MPAVVQGTGGTEINEMDMVLVRVSSPSRGKTDPSLTRQAAHQLIVNHGHYHGRMMAM